MTLQSVIDQVVASPYCYPKDRAEVKAGMLKTVGFIWLGSMGAMSALSLLTDASWSRRIQWSLLAGSAWSLPMGAISAALYTKLATPPEKSREVVEIASQATDDELQEIKGDKQRAVATKAVQYARSIDPIAGLHAFVSCASAIDFRAPLSERFKEVSRDALFVGIGVGIAVWTFIQSAGLADSALSGPPSFFNWETRLTTQLAATVGVGMGGLLLVTVLCDRPTNRLADMPGTQHWTKVAHNLGNVEERLAAFYAQERPGGDHVKNKVYQLLVG